MSLKILHHYLLPKKLLTIAAGLFARSTNKVIKNFLISNFIKLYKVDMLEAQHPDIESYNSFNDFFIRKLASSARKFANADIISPVDGVISEMGDVTNGTLLQAKNKTYSIYDLTYEKLELKKFITFYLSPKDYHRVHLPVDAKLEKMQYIPGALFSVQRATTKAIKNLFARNERLVMHFTTPKGKMVLVMVGATIVGSIVTPWHGELKRLKKAKTFSYIDKQLNFSKGDEVGYFKLGSTVILLFEEDFKFAKNVVTDKEIKLGHALI